MTTPRRNIVLFPAQRLGVVAATSAAICAIVYDVGQLAEWLGWLGSGGGPQSASTPLGLILLLTPSLLLGPTFVVTLASLHEITPPKLRIWSFSAVLFSVIYCVLISINYFVQLTLVVPRMLTGRVAGIELLLFTPFDSFLYSLDILGYSYMSVATWLASYSIPRLPNNQGLQHCLRWTGWLLPFLALQMFWQMLIWPASLWAILFPTSMLLLRQFFRRDIPDQSDQELSQEGSV